MTVAQLCTPQLCICFTTAKLPNYKVVSVPSCSIVYQLHSYVSARLHHCIPVTQLCQCSVAPLYTSYTVVSVLNCTIVCQLHSCVSAQLHHCMPVVHVYGCIVAQLHSCTVAQKQSDIICTISQLRRSTVAQMYSACGRFLCTVVPVGSKSAPLRQACCVSTARAA